MIIVFFFFCKKACRVLFLYFSDNNKINLRESFICPKGFKAVPLPAVNKKHIL